MAQQPLRTTAGRFWGALFVACLLTGFAAALLWILVLAFMLAGTFGKVVGGVLLIWVVITLQQGIVHMFTHWRPAFGLLLAAAVPGIALAVFLDLAGYGAFAGLAACAVQALVLRLLAPEPELDAAMLAPRPPRFSEIRRGIAAPPAAAAPEADPVLHADDSNPASGGIHWRG